MPRRAITAAGLAVVILVVVALTAAAAPAARAGNQPLRAYRGLGIWVDMYDDTAWNAPAAAARDMAEHHVRTLFIETSNYHWSTSVNRRAALGSLIEHCHARGIKVVAWYLPGFTNPTRDYSRSMAAIHFRSAGGQRFDSFGLDIEASLVKSISTRNARLHALSDKIRHAVGSSYTLGAIIPSPIGMSHNASYWPNFPYKMLAGIYDVFVPMGYYTYHGDGYANAYSDTRHNVMIIREKTGRPTEPIHVIAGLASASSRNETLAFVRALREYGCIGGSMYDWPTTNAGDWASLMNIRFNPLEVPALPRTIGYAAGLGNFPGEHLHPKEVFYQAPRQTGDRVLRFELYDAQAGEVRLLVNWKDEGALAAGPTGDWSDLRSRPIPAADLRAGGRNVIGFVAKGAWPDWTVWGVRNVTLTTP